MNELLYKLNKSREDIEQLLVAHKNLIYHMLSKTGQLQNQDAESAAWEALWDAINLFDVFCKTQFSTYACTLIKNAIYDTIRKQNKLLAEIQLEDDQVYIFDLHEADQVDTVRLIENIYKSYISRKTGLVKDILLVWYGASFEISQREIADRCHCSISYVGRVQQSFRAYLSGKLKKS